jgi:hypothetical protein
MQAEDDEEMTVEGTESLPKPRHGEKRTQPEKPSPVCSGIGEAPTYEAAQPGTIYASHSTPRRLSLPASFLNAAPSPPYNTTAGWYSSAAPLSRRCKRGAIFPA